MILSWRVNLFVELGQLVQECPEMMFENARVATRSQSALHGRGRLSANALGRPVPHKNFEWGLLLPLWCILDCSRGRGENRWLSLATLDLQNKPTCLELELFESTENVPWQDWRGDFLA